MKNRFMYNLVLVIAVLTTLSLTSCKDMCYECTGFDDGTTTLDDLGTICVGQDDGLGGTTSEDDVHQAVAAYRAFGGTCVMK